MAETVLGLGRTLFLFGFGLGPPPDVVWGVVDPLTADVEENPPFGLFGIGGGPRVVPFGLGGM